MYSFFIISLEALIVVAVSKPKILLPIQGRNLLLIAFPILLPRHPAARSSPLAIEAGSSRNRKFSAADTDLPTLVFSTASANRELF